MYSIAVATIEGDTNGFVPSSCAPVCEPGEVDVPDELRSQSVEQDPGALKLEAQEAIEAQEVPAEEVQFDPQENNTDFVVTLVKNRPQPPDNSNACTIVGTARGDILKGTPDRDVVCGQSGGDIIKGLGGNDILRGGAGRDILYGGPGNDRLFGQGGKDILKGGPGRDVLRGGPGKDIQRQ